MLPLPVLVAMLCFLGWAGCQKKWRDDWCGSSGWVNSCSDGRAFDWLAQYDKCVDRTIDDDTLKFVNVTSVPAYCALFFLPKGVSTDQISRYRGLNPTPLKDRAKTEPPEKR
jgi:hypothetical protein